MTDTKRRYKIIAIVDDWPRHPVWAGLGVGVKVVAWAMLQLRNERTRWAAQSKQEDILRLQAKTPFPASYAEIAAAASCSRRHAMHGALTLVHLGLAERVTRGWARDGRKYVRANTWRVPNWTAERLDTARKILGPHKPYKGGRRIPSRIVQDGERLSLPTSDSQSPQTAR